MAQLLFDFGASKSTLHSGILHSSGPLTAFQALFWQSFKGKGLLEQHLELARVFLINDQDPNVDVFCHEIPRHMRDNPLKAPPRPSRCKPLHAANYRLCKKLLKRHADVNGLDCLQRTPLDVNILYFQFLEEECASAIVQIFYTNFCASTKETQKDALKRIVLLADAGGCINVCGDEELKLSYESELVKDDPSLVERLRNIPRLGSRMGESQYDDRQSSSEDEYVVD